MQHVQQGCLPDQAYGTSCTAIRERLWQQVDPFWILSHALLPLDERLPDTLGNMSSAWRVV